MAGSTIRYHLLAQVLVTAAFIVSTAGARNDTRSQRGEQTAFAADTIPGEVAIRKPVDISNDALQILRNTERVRGCVKAAGLTPEQVPASWFVGSKIHLDGPNEVDVIAEPRDLPKKPSANRCLYGAHAIPFWVLQQAQGKYELLLETNADGLFVLSSRTKGYRDIREVTGFIGSTVYVTFQFDGEKYQVSKREDKPN